MTVVIVEDDALAAKILAEYIRGDEIIITGIYESAEIAIECIGKLPLPDIVLMDIGLPGMSGIEATSILKRQYPSLKIVVQSIFEDTETIMNAIKAGAEGYLLKASSRAEIHAALREVYAGGSPLSGKVASKILEQCRKKNCDTSGANKNEFGLTARELEILDELMQGKACKCIASDLSISLHTVNNHLRSIYEKMQVNSRSEVAAKFIQKK